MEFNGRISRVLPVRTGTSQKGEWKTLPFVFEYFEKDDQRWPDRVLLETFDTNIHAQIAPYLENGADGKAIERNGELAMIRDIPVKIGFWHNVDDGTRKDGTKFTANRLKIYKFEVIAGQQQQPAGNPAGTVAQTAQPQMQQPQFGQQGAAPFPPQVDANGNPTYDDLPF